MWPCDVFSSMQLVMWAKPKDKLYNKLVPLIKNQYASQTIYLLTAFRVPLSVYLIDNNLHNYPIVLNYLDFKDVTR